MKKNYFCRILFSALAAVFLFASCKSAEMVPVKNEPVESPYVKTYVNTSVNKSTNTISTVLVFERITELTAIHPMSRERWNITAANFNYSQATTELKINMPKEIPYKISDLAFHIVGEALNPGVFVLTGIDSARGGPGVFFEGKAAQEGTDYSYDKNSERITCIAPVNVDTSSFQICWATRNGIVTFSNNTEKYKDAYRKFYNEWSRKSNLQ